MLHDFSYRLYDTVCTKRQQTTRDSYPEKTPSVAACAVTHALTCLIVHRLLRPQLPQDLSATLWAQHKLANLLLDNLAAGLHVPTRNKKRDKMRKV